MTAGLEGPAPVSSVEKILLPRSEPSSGSSPPLRASYELSPAPQEVSPPLEICPAYHTQGGQPPHQQPKEVEEGVQVDVVGDEQDNAVPKEAIALGRKVERRISQGGLAFGPSRGP